MVVHHPLHHHQLPFPGALVAWAGLPDSGVGRCGHRRAAGISESCHTRFSFTRTHKAGCKSIFLWENSFQGCRAHSYLSRRPITWFLLQASQHLSLYLHRLEMVSIQFHSFVKISSSFPKGILIHGKGFLKTQWQVIFFFNKMKQIEKPEFEMRFLSICFCTGSAHSVLAPYWGKRLDKTKMLARSATEWMQWIN